MATLISKRRRALEGVGQGQGLRGGRRFLPSAGALLLLGALVFLVVYPLFILFYATGFDIQSAAERVSRVRGLGTSIRNTVLLAVGAVLLAGGMGTALAWCAQRLRPNLVGFAALLGAAPLLLPPLSTVVGWTFVFSPRIGYGNQLLRAISGGRIGDLDVYSLTAIVLVASSYLTPFVFLFISTALRELDSRLESAARISGASWWRTQISIVAPLIKPAFIYSALVVILLGLGQFVAPLILGRNPGIEVITTTIFRLFQTPPVDFTVGAILGVPVVLIALMMIFVQRRLLSGIRQMGGTRGATVRYGDARWPLVPMGVFAFVAFVPPMLALLTVSLSPFWMGTVELDLLSLDNFRQVLGDSRARSAIYNTVMLASVGTMVGLAVCTIAAYLVVRGGFMPRKDRRLTRIVADYIVNVPLMVPSILVAAGVLLGYGLLGPRLLGSRALFLIAYVIIVLPHGARLMAAGVQRTGYELERAGRVAGASPLGVLRQITLPMLRRSFMAAAVILFIMMVHEFAASMMVRTSVTHTMSTFLFEMLNFGTGPLAATVALLMALVSSIGVLVIGRSLPGGRA